MAGLTRVIQTAPTTDSKQRFGNASATQTPSPIAAPNVVGAAPSHDFGSIDVARTPSPSALPLHDPTVRFARTVTFHSSDEYAKSTAGSPEVWNADGSVTATVYEDRPPPSITSPPVAAKPKMTPKPKPKPRETFVPTPVSARRLTEIAEAMQPRLIYPKNFMRAVGGIQLIGGGLELAGAVLTTETGVGPVLLGAHGLDSIQTGARMMWSGEAEHTVLYYAGSGAVFLVSDDTKLANAGGIFADMAGGVGAGAYALSIAPSPTFALSPEAELDLELSQLANLEARPKFGVQFDTKWQDIQGDVLKPDGYILNPRLQKLDSLINDAGKIGGKNYNGQPMFVIDQEGAIHIGYRGEGAMRHMPHPTLLGGEDPTVLAAGIIDIRAGRIYQITNVSGHFQPSPNSLGAMYESFSKLPNSAFAPNFSGIRVFYF